jgi:hypothetical protein
MFYYCCTASFNDICNHIITAIRCHSTIIIYYIIVNTGGRRMAGNNFPSDPAGNVVDIYYISWYRVGNC